MLKKQYDMDIDGTLFRLCHLIRLNQGGDLDERTPSDYKEADKK